MVKGDTLLPQLACLPLLPGLILQTLLPVPSQGA